MKLYSLTFGQFVDLFDGCDFRLELTDGKRNASLDWDTFDKCWTSYLSSETECIPDDVVNGLEIKDLRPDVMRLKWPPKERAMQ